MAKGYTGWKLSPATRANLLSLIPPVYDRVIAHHITCEMGADETTPLPWATKAKAVLVVDDGKGLQAVRVIVERSTTKPGEWPWIEIRPDKRLFHITWSLTGDRKPFESNQLVFDGVAQFPMMPIPVQKIEIEFDIEPAFIRHGESPR